MKHLRLFEEFDKEDIITLYHGTTEHSAKALINNGWVSGNYIGSNMGNSNYLYLTSEPEDALWFANENGGNSIVEVSNIPISYLRPDPEDEAGYTMYELLDYLYSDNKYKLPVKFILTKPLDEKHFNIYETP